MTIFTAAVVALYNGKFDSRNIGWAPNYSDLRADIDRRGSDLIEAKYNYIVIEEVRDGIWGFVVEGSERWLKWDDLLEFWVACEKPEELRGTIHWTMY